MQDDIGMKDVYGKVIKLEAMIESQEKSGGETTKQFKWFAILLVILGILNIVVHILI